MPRFGSGFEVYIQNTPPLNPSPGDFWFDTSGSTVLKFYTPQGGFLTIAVPTAALDTISANLVSVMSVANAVSANLASILSIANAVSARADTLSAQGTSITSALGLLSTNAASVTSALGLMSTNLASITSNLGLLSTNLVSVTSNLGLLSTNHVSLLSLANALSARVDTMSNQVSVISSGLGGVQMRWVSTVNGISSTAAAGAAISGLSISVAAGGVYQVEGKVYVRMSALDALGISFTFPGMVFAAGEVRGAAGVAGGGGLGQAMSERIGAFDENGSNSIVWSAIMSSLSTTILHVNAMFNVSTGGTIQANARVSATGNPVNIQPGSYLRAYKIV